MLWKLVACVGPSPPLPFGSELSLISLKGYPTQMTLWSQKLTTVAVAARSINPTVGRSCQRSKMDAHAFGCQVFKVNISVVALGRTPSINSRRTRCQPKLLLTLRARLHLHLHHHLQLQLHLPSSLLSLQLGYNLDCPFRAAAARFEFEFELKL